MDNKKLKKQIVLAAAITSLAGATHLNPSMALAGDHKGEKHAEKKGKNSCPGQADKEGKEKNGKTKAKSKSDKCGGGCGSKHK